MTAYVGIDGKARNVKSAYIGVDGVAREVKKAYVGVNGVARLWWSAGGGDPVISISGNPIMAFGSSAYAAEYDASDPKSSVVYVNGEHRLPAGTIIKCAVGADKGYTGSVVLNGETVFTKIGQTGVLGVTTGVYLYEVTCNATIDVATKGSSSDKDRVGTITITES